MFWLIQMLLTPSKERLKLEIIAQKIKVYGKVQGVSFKAYCLKKAQEIGLCGWVQNNPDKSVEIFAQGNQNQLNEITFWANSGSPYARVDKVEITQIPVISTKQTFKIKY